MFIFQFPELMTEKNIWQYGVEGKHLFPKSEQHQIHLLTPMNCQVCSQSPPCVTQMSTCAEIHWLVLCFALDTDLLILQLSTLKTDHGFSHSQQSTEDKDMTHGIFSKCCGMHRQNSLGFFKFQIIDHLIQRVSPSALERCPRTLSH